MSIRRSLLVVVLTLVVIATMAGVSPAQDSGTLTIGVHVTLVNRWLDPGEAEGLITPFMVLYPLHDALVKPMPGNLYAPSLAESTTVSKDGAPAIDRHFDSIVTKPA